MQKHISVLHDFLSMNNKSGRNKHKRKNKNSYARNVVSGST